MGVWNRTRLDIAIEKESDDDYIVLDANGKQYAGYMNSVKIVKYDDGDYEIYCDGYDTIIKTYVDGTQLILDVECKKRETYAKICVNFINEDVIYFVLLEGETYSDIDYGKETPYIRAKLLSEQS